MRNVLTIALKLAVIFALTMYVGVLCWDLFRTLRNHFQQIKYAGVKSNEENL